MENDFTEADIMLIEKEVSHKTFKDIAFLLDKPKELVAEFIKKWVVNKDIIPFNTVVESNKKPRKPRALLPKKEKKKKAVIISRVIEKEQKLRRDRNGQPIFKTKQVDYSKLESVRIDDKTLVYCKPGETPQEAKARYIKNITTRQEITPSYRMGETRKRKKEL